MATALTIHVANIIIVKEGDGDGEDNSIIVFMSLLLCCHEGGYIVIIVLSLVTT